MKNYKSSLLLVVLFLFSVGQHILKEDLTKCYAKYFEIDYFYFSKISVVFLFVVAGLILTSFLLAPDPETIVAKVVEIIVCYAPFVCALVAVCLYIFTSLSFVISISTVFQLLCFGALVATAKTVKILKQN